MEPDGDENVLGMNWNVNGYWNGNGHGYGDGDWYEDADEKCPGHDRRAGQAELVGNGSRFSKDTLTIFYHVFPRVRAISNAFLHVRTSEKVPALTCRTSWCTRNKEVDESIITRHRSTSNRFIHHRVVEGE